MKKIGAFLPLAIAACSPAQDNAANGTAAVTAQTRQAPGYALRSNVAGASLVKVAELPSITPAHVDPESFCAERFIQPVSRAGKLAAQKGWRVEREEKFHQFQTVLIVRGLDPMTSGRCAPIDANVAIFEGDRLIGLLFAKGKDGIAIGTMVPVDGHLRIWTPDPVVEGQVNLDGASLTFDKITSTEQFCQGKLRVPAVYRQNYSQARRTLLAAGWTARPSEEEASSRYDNVVEVRSRYPEADHCAGTGYGECGFTLTAPDGVSTLEIATIGDSDDPIISDYSATCAGKASN